MKEQRADEAGVADLRQERDEAVRQRDEARGDASRLRAELRERAEQSQLERAELAAANLECRQLHAQLDALIAAQVDAQEAGLEREVERLRAEWDSENERFRRAAGILKETRADLAEAEAVLRMKHDAYRALYTLWLRVARAMTPQDGPDITDEQVAERAEATCADLAEAREALQTALVRFHATDNNGYPTEEALRGAAYRLVEDVRLVLAKGES